MISRRIIRIKVLQILYAYYSSPEKSINSSEKELFFCIHKAYDLYHYLFDLILEVVKYDERHIEIRRNKHRPTDQDLHPNTRFIDNRLINLLKQNKQLNLYISQKKLSWVNHPELIKELYNRLVESDIYKEYIALEESTFATDQRFIDKVYNKIFLYCEELYQVLEEQSIYWNDDIEYTISMISKSLKKFREDSDGQQPLMPLFKDEEDRDFAKGLFRKAIINHDEIRGLIDVHSRNWDLDRIAFVDIIIMQLAITEFLYFPTIPTKVTLNEYIEITKYYSTEKSRSFINGILDKTLKDLKKSDMVKKSGRGLIGEV
ncbi:MAG: transcription antitermination factor NusB [Chlorobi bacterium]|nr:transcription antitermination factor NusB [Chlorobiota bacterium]